MNPILGLNTLQNLTLGESSYFSNHIGAESIVSNPNQVESNGLGELKSSLHSIEGNLKCHAPEFLET